MREHHSSRNLTLPEIKIQQSPMLKSPRNSSSLMDAIKVQNSNQSGLPFQTPQKYFHNKSRSTVHQLIERSHRYKQKNRTPLKTRYEEEFKSGLTSESDLRYEQYRQGPRDLHDSYSPRYLQQMGSQLASRSMAQVLSPKVRAQQSPSPKKFKNQQVDFLEKELQKQEIENRNSVNVKQSNDEKHTDENMQLVPSRWSHTGWKYQAKDPSQEKYFRNPNRVNQFGDKIKLGGQVLEEENNISKQRKSLLGRVLAQHPANAIKIKGGEGNKDDNEHFKTMNQVNYNQKSPKWQANLVSPRYRKDEDQYLWGGDMQSRINFKKQKNASTDWTELLFRN